jgi:hypothetical protein
LIAAEPGWIDLAAAAPLMCTDRVREELGWHPRHDAGATVQELLAGFRERAGADTPPLQPRPGGTVLDAATTEAPAPVPR